MVELFVGEKSAGRGTGKSKKAAEQDAAYHAILKIKREK
jgi:ribonuclease-3